MRLTAEDKLALIDLVKHAVYWTRARDVVVRFECGDTYETEFIREYCRSRYPKLRFYTSYLRFLECSSPGSDT